MADLETVMKSSHSPPCKYFAVYSNPKAMEQFGLLCLQYQHRYTPCVGLREAKKMLKDEWHKIDAIVIDIHLAEQNGLEFFRFLKEKSYDHIQVYVTYDEKEMDSMTEARLVSLEKHIQETNSQTITITTWSITSTDATTSSSSQPNEVGGGLRFSDSTPPLSLAAFKDPQYKSTASSELALALSETVSTELTLGTGSEYIAEEHSNSCGNKRQRTR